MNESDQLEILRSQPYFQDFTNDELVHLLKLSEIVELNKDDIIIKEGDKDKYCYIIIDGQAEVIKETLSSEALEDAVEFSLENVNQLNSIPISTLNSGDSFGELAFLQNTERSATIKAATPIKLLKLETFDTSELAKLNKDAAIKMLNNLMSRLVISLRRTNEINTAMFRQGAEHFKARFLLGKLIANVVVIMFLYNLLIQLSINLSKYVPMAATFVSVGLIFIAMLFVIYIVSRRIKQMGLTLDKYGITLKNWKKSIFHSVMWTTVFLGLITAFKWVLIQTIPKYNDFALFDISSHLDNFNAFIIAVIGYSVFAPMQEFIARGVLQGTLETYLSGENRIHRSIFLSNALFAATHVHLSTWFALAVFLPGIFWGYLYVQQRNLIGVSISHIIIGLYAVYVMNFFKMFSM